MEIIKTKARMKEWSRSIRNSNETVGFVPTMGYLHDGHLSLMRRARQENDFVAASIFVNPIQFGPNEDLNSYPRDPDADIEKCGKIGVEALFMPDRSEIYAPDHKTYVDVADLSENLCGASRPGHFRGVCTVVLKLFNIVQPTAAYFGMKDFQQLSIIRTMTRDLDLDINIVPCEIIRESDGLAMSSRNSYLSPEQRKQAVCLYEALNQARSIYASGEKDPAVYLSAMEQIIRTRQAAEADYIKLVDIETLNDCTIVGNGTLAALAVRFGKTRLIDNMLLQK